MFRSPESNRPLQTVSQTIRLFKIYKYRYCNQMIMHVISIMFFLSCVCTNSFLDSAIFRICTVCYYRNRLIIV